jgi:hypothetical protein
MFENFCLLLLGKPAARLGHHSMVRTLLELGADCEREGVVKFDGHVIEGT